MLAVKIPARTFIWCSEDNCRSWNRAVVAIRHSDGNRNGNRLTNAVLISIALHNLKAQSYFGLCRQARLSKEQQNADGNCSASMAAGLGILCHGISSINLSKR